MFQFSNGSGMYTMADQNYNLAKELPPGWELRFLSTGPLVISCNYGSITIAVLFWRKINTTSVACLRFIDMGLMRIQ